MQRKQFFLLAALIVLADQFTKSWVVKSLSIDSSLSIVPGVLYLSRTTNTGAAFGVFPHATIVLAVAALAAGAAIVIYAFRLGWPLPVLIGIGLALPLGGAIGNFADRVRLGHVIDFIEVHVGSYVWPNFNVADSAICIGVGLLTLVALTASSPAVEQEKTHSLP